MIDKVLVQFPKFIQCYWVSKTLIRFKIIKMGKLRKSCHILTTVILSISFISSCYCAGVKSESELIASMREMQLPSQDAVDIYASHSPSHSRFRVPRAVKFVDEDIGVGGAHGKKSEAVSASFTVGPSGLSGSLSAAQADGEKTKGYFGAYPGVAGGGGYYPPPPPFYGGGGGGGYPGYGPGLNQQSSSASAASASSGGGGGFGGRPGFGGGPIVPILGGGGVGIGPVSHSGGSAATAAAAGGSDGYNGGGGYYPGSGTGFGGGPGFYPGGGFGGGYPGQNYGYYPGSGVGGYYGYPGGYQGGYPGGGYRPNFVGGVAPPVGGLYGSGFGPGGYLPSTNGFYGGGPGYYGGGYGYGGFRKGDAQNGQGDEKGNVLGDKEKYGVQGDLNKNYNPGFSSSSKKPSTGGGVIFKDN